VILGLLRVLQANTFVIKVTLVIKEAKNLFTDSYFRTAPDQGIAIAGGTLND